ncbi:glycosyltransferase family 4 protein [Nocardioides sp. TRM66260-LWL]|uniref:glycosyltransferase family 4 protein n=1 Tax=Nocardioides sp. TRM66260-LWL TaxID=2874478 RepID=UPI001CC50BBA|nr:glycosyltransferase family 4 protein [Nocardioides sp. TRM66260-LWL]MBZ5734895.1 glycosyltransferase family 4 protein [Nocardioides sp. TRM66260-LWL]
MRLLLQHPHAADEISGVLTYVHEIGAALRRASGCEVELISTAASSRSEQWRAIGRADAVHMNSNDPVFALLCRLRRRRVVLKLHYHVFQSTHDRCEPLPWGRSVRREVRFVAAKSGLGSRYFWETMVRLVARFVAIGLAHDVRACSRFLAASTGLRRVVGEDYPMAIGTDPVPPPGEPTFLFLGRLAPDKGCDLLIAAAARLHDEGLAARFVVAGDGPERAALEAGAAALPAGTVRFLGRRPPEEVPHLVDACTAVVQPARWEEPAGFTPLEAAARGRPTVAARIGGLPETAGPAGYLVEPEDVDALASRLRSIVLDPAEAARRGVAAREHLRVAFDPDAAARRLLSALTPAG